MTGARCRPRVRRHLSLGIREQDKKRTLDLLTKQQHESITDKERDELDSYVQADNILSILKVAPALSP